MKEGPTLKEKLQLEKCKIFLKKIAPSLKWKLIISISIVIGGIIVFSYINNKSQDYSTKDSSTTDSNSNTTDTNCNVQGISLHGTVVTYNSPDSYNDQDKLMYDQTSADNVLWYIKDAQNKDNIKAIVIEVDSSGGSPVAGEEMSQAIKDSSKPVVAYIRNIGASAAYWAISSADRIFASRNSDVGSIGVTMSYLSNVGNNQKNGYTYVQLSSGKFKDTGSPDKILTDAEKALLLRDVNIMYNNFVSDVALNRGLTVKAVKSFADGSTVLGSKAKELGMIDEIGGLPEVQKYLETKIGEKPDICW